MLCVTTIQSCVIYRVWVLLFNFYIFTFSGGTFKIKLSQTCIKRPLNGLNKKRPLKSVGILTQVANSVESPFRGLKWGLLIQVVFNGILCNSEASLTLNN